MFKNIDFQVSETGAITDEFHSILILTKLVEVTKKIDELYQNESDEEVKAFALKPKKYIREKSDKFKALLEEAIIKHKLNVGMFQKDYSKKTYADFEKVFMPFTAPEWCIMGSEAQDYFQKIEYFSNAIALDTTFTAAYISRGNCHDFLGKHETAIQDYQKAIQLDPHNAVVYYNCGISYKNLNQYDEAIRSYTKAIELDSGNVAAYINRGVCYDNLRKYDKAIKDYTKAIELDSQNSAAFKNRGMSYRKIGKYHQAIKDHKKVIEFLPEDATAYYNLGCAYWDLKEWEAVVTAWEKVLEIQPKHQYVLKNMKFAKKYAREARIKRAIGKK